MSIRVHLQHALEGFRLAVDFEAPGTGVTAIFGPSGSGKTQSLRAIAGLERQAGNRISINGEVWQDEKHFLPVARRGVGYVFQESSLFEHLDVLGNINFGRKRQGITRTEYRDQLIELLGLQTLLHRRPGTLSGGERQRVSLARALAPEPRVLLMDEPLAGQDDRLKAEVLPYFDTLFRQLEVPVLLVSHDRNEVSRLASHLILLNEGEVIAAGPLADLMTRMDLPLAFSPEAGAVLKGRVLNEHNAWGLAEIEAGGCVVQVPAETLKKDQDVRLQFAARDVSLCITPPTDSSILNILPVRVAALEPNGAMTHVQLLLPDNSQLLSCITQRSAEALNLSPGMALSAQVKGVAIFQ